MSHILFFIEVVLGGILLSSAIDHSKNRYIFQNEIRKYNLIKNKVLINDLSVIIILLEFVLGLFFVLHISKWTSIIGSILLFLLFTFAILINLIKGNVNINCGCGGIVGDQLLSWKLLIRNIYIILLLIFDLIYSYILTDSKTVYNPAIISIIYGTALLTLLIIKTNAYLKKIGELLT
ncbi:MauE/DoxX family redox-associated membrane protein [Bacillus andreraoultii]|uniref:MauE/DoxX family redox-associated membrane protein n=1 Tax=Bacillus andreraoultii TaxID=1499685 RepID=UPI000539FE51